MAIGACVALTALSPRAAELEWARALDRLRAGNVRFTKGALTPAPTAPMSRPGLAAEQRPVAMVLSCADARVPPEYIFDAALGELYVVRAAGAVVDRAVMASLEHGVTRLHIPLLVVMGHESCDVVRAVVEAGPVAEPAADYLTASIRAGLRYAPEDGADLRSAILANVEQVINDAMGSSVLRDASASGHLQVVGAYYELGSGQVVFSQPIAPTPTVHR